MLEEFIEKWLLVSVIGLFILYLAIILAIVTRTLGFIIVLLQTIFVSWWLNSTWPDVFPDSVWLAIIPFAILWFVNAPIRRFVNNLTDLQRQGFKERWKRKDDKA